MKIKAGKFKLRIKKLSGSPRWGYAKSTHGIHTNIAGYLCDLTWYN